MRSPGRSPSLARVRQLALIGSGWFIVGLGVLIAPLPGPGGLPVILVGSVLVLRNSSDARKLFVRMKRRHPRLFSPVERLRRRLRRRNRASHQGQAQG